MAQKEVDLAQAVAAAVTGVSLSQFAGPESIWWLIVSLAACSLADMAVEATQSRLKLFRRYLASVVVTMAASYGLTAALLIYSPEWRDHLWAARLLTALGVGLGLHMLLPRIPDMFSDIWAVLIGRFKRNAGVQ